MRLVPCGIVLRVRLLETRQRGPTRKRKHHGRLQSLSAEDRAETETPSVAEKIATLAAVLVLHVSQNNVSVVNPLDASSCRSGDVRDVSQESASMAWARAFYALAQGLKPGDRIATGVIEYGANYVAMLQVMT